MLDYVILVFVIFSHMNFINIYCQNVTIIRWKKKKKKVQDPPVEVTYRDLNSIPLDESVARSVLKIRSKSEATLDLVQQV